MAFDKDAFLTALDSMTVMELNDLVKAIEEKFGVSAAAMAAPAAGGAAAVLRRGGGRPRGGIRFFTFKLSHALVSLHRGQTAILRRSLRRQSHWRNGEKSRRKTGHDSRHTQTRRELLR